MVKKLLFFFLLVQIAFSGASFSGETQLDLCRVLWGGRMVKLHGADLFALKDRLLNTVFKNKKEILWIEPWFHTAEFGGLYVRLEGENVPDDYPKKIEGIPISYFPQTDINQSKLEIEEQREAFFLRQKRNLKNTRIKPDSSDIERIIFTVTQDLGSLSKFAQVEVIEVEGSQGIRISMHLKEEITSSWDFQHDFAFFNDKLKTYTPLLPIFIRYFRPDGSLLKEVSKEDN